MALWALMMLFIVYLPRIAKTLVPPTTIAIRQEKMKEIKEFERHITLHSNTKKHRKTYRVPPARFNPNRYSLEEWMYLGLSRKQASAVLKFCRFPLKSKDDLRKIFIIPKELYELIKDSTYYEVVPKYPPHEKPKFPEKQVAIVRISMDEIDSTKLVSLPGIGPFYAKMVMKHEQALGGFHSKEQLLEVYKMNEEIYTILCKHLDFSQPKIRKISINRASKEELAKHPYLDWAQANSIVKMRKQLGGYRSLEELLDSHLINPETFDKILPYVSL